MKERRELRGQFEGTAKSDVILVLEIDPRAWYKLGK
jgi:hypothetical protein